MRLLTLTFGECLTARGTWLVISGLGLCRVQRMIAQKVRRRRPPLECDSSTRSASPLADTIIVGVLFNRISSSKLNPLNYT